MTAEEIEKSGFDFQKEMYKQAVELSKEGNLKPNDLFTKYESASQPFIEIRDSFSRMKESITNNDGELDFSGFNPAGDLDLLFGTAKTLDPGGRVTDSDVAIQTLSTGKYGDKLRKIAQRFSRKGNLAPGEREALYNAALKRFNSAELQQKKTTEQFSGLAKKNGLNPSNILRDVGIADGSVVSNEDDGTFILPSGTKVWRE
jgi:hypothetical protein